MIVDYINSILVALGNIGLFLYVLSFVVSFLESLAFVGTFIPGGIFLAVCGFLASQGNFNPWLLIIFAALGAILGDTLSFYAGSRGTRFFKNENKFLRLSHLQTGKNFFKKHGTKSVFLGRFIGPLRPIIPFIAGLMEMDSSVFILWNVLSGILWAIAYVFLGYFFGGALNSIEVWSSRMTALIFFFVLSAGLIWIVLKRGRRIAVFGRKALFHFFGKILASKPARNFARKHPSVFQFIQARLNTTKFSGFRLTALISLAICSVLLLAGLIQDVVYSETIIFVDIRIENLLYFFRSPELSRIFLWVTSLGNLTFVLVAIVSTVLIFILRRKWVFILPLVVSVGGAGILTYLQKILVMRPRPLGNIPLFNERSFSFPSGHAAIAISFYGFLAYFFIKHLKKWKYRSYVLFVSIMLVLTIGFSRMYLGVHYLSDVLGGYLTGTIWLVSAISLAELFISKIPDWRKESKRFPAVWARQASVLVILFVFAFYSYYAFSFSPKLNNVFQTYNGFTVDYPLKVFSDLPKNTEGLFGSTQEPISFVFVASSDSDLLKQFTDAGWNIADDATPESLYRTFQAVIAGGSYPNAPLTPAFWNNKVNDFGIEKPTVKNSARERHHARIWKTGAVTLSGQNIYVGTASFDVGIKWGITHRISPDLDMERESLWKDLADSGVVLDWAKIQMVPAVSGENLTGDPFNTDGQAYLIYLR